MGRTQENDKSGQVDHLQGEASRRVDVIGNADTIIIPAIHELFNISLSYLRDDAKESQEKILETTITRLVKPLWGSRTGSTVDLTGDTPSFALDGFTANGGDIRGDALWEGAENMTLDTSVAIAEHSVLAGARNSRITSSLLVGAEVLCGDDDAATFNAQQLQLLLQIINGIRTGDQRVVKRALINFRVEGYLRGLFSHDDMYAGYGEGAVAAKAIDRKYLPALQGGESTEIAIEDSVVFGRHTALRNVLGGTVKNSVIAGSLALPYSHLNIENTWVISDDHAVFIENGHTGSPRLAKAAVEMVKDLPPSPLLNM